MELLEYFLYVHPQLLLLLGWHTYGATHGVCECVCRPCVCLAMLFH